MKQFVTVKFNPWDQRSYTYVDDGLGLRPGEHAIVETARGEAEVVVIKAGVEPPPFECKTIVRRA